MIDADGSYLGKYRKTHIPHVKGFWEKFYFRPGNTGYPIFDTKVGRIGLLVWEPESLGLYQSYGA